MGSWRWALAAATTFAAASLGCSHASAPTYFSRDDLLDPMTCGGCHGDHYDDWSASMHAYASDDPVFLAMNQRGQRETNGQLGSFCVKCHAPMAVNEGATSDGLNLANVPQKLHGVTCFFCHTVESVEGTHDNPLVLANDITMRGEYDNPVASAAHPSTYSVLHDRDQLGSASLCGACHDIVTTQGAAIERTYGEWQASIFSQTVSGNTCSQCHMQELPRGAALQPIAQAPGALPRKFHVHSFPAVDSALTPSFPPLPVSDAGEPALQDFLDTTLQAAICVVQQDGNGAIRVIVDNVAAGHAVPSGASQDRRMWAEVIAYQNDKVVYQSGVVPNGVAVTSVTNDPDLWLIRDCMFDAQGNQVNMFWQAASSFGFPQGYESNLIPYPVTTDPTDIRYYQTHVEQFYPRNSNATLPAMPDKVTLRIRIQPVGLDVLQDLVNSKDLDPSYIAQMPTLELPEPMLTWTAATANATYVEGPNPVSCVTVALNVAADKVPADNHTKCSP